MSKAKVSLKKIPKIKRGFLVLLPQLELKRRAKCITIHEYGVSALDGVISKTRIFGSIAPARSEMACEVYK